MPPPSVNKAAHSAFETQRGHHQKSKKGISGPTKNTYALKIILLQSQDSSVGRTSARSHTVSGGMISRSLSPTNASQV